MNRRSIQLNLIVFALVVVIICPAQAGTYSGGSGTEDDPYQIATAEDLVELSQDPNNWDKNFLLTADIDMTGQTMTPIGSDEDSAFRGEFDGDGHSISNLHMNMPDVNNVGLFGYAVSARISNLNLADVNVTGHAFVGALVGTYASGKVIRSCSVTGSLTGHSYVGALCGYELLSHGSFEECYTQADVTGVQYVGGLVGYLNTGTAVSCYSLGSVNGSDYCGGLVGRMGNSSTVTQCYVEGIVHGTRYTGGLVGSARNIVNCYAAARVDGGYKTGGLVGQYGSVESSFWDIDVSGTSESERGIGLSTEEMKQHQIYSVNGWGNQGWILDEGNDYPRLAWEDTPGREISDPRITWAGSGTFLNPYLIRSADGLQTISLGTFFWDKHYVLIEDVDLSGISLGPIGRDEWNAFTGVFDGDGHVLSNLTIASSQSDNVGLFGYVANGRLLNLGLEDVEIVGRNCTGALAGYLRGGDIIGCYATGRVNGWEDVGGLIGYSRNEAQIARCYSLCDVTGREIVGGLAGNLNSTHLTDCLSGGIQVSVGIQECAGGLLGRFYRHRVENSLSLASVEDKGRSGGFIGLVASSGSRFSGSFWSVTGSGLTYAIGWTGGDANGISGLTAAQATEQVHYLDAGWDFVGESENGTEDIWFMEDGGTPQLVWPTRKIEWTYHDWDNDVHANFASIEDFIAQWAEYAPDNLADVDSDGVVDYYDLLLMPNRTLVLQGTLYVVDSISDNIVSDGLVTLREAIAAATSNESVGDAPAGRAGEDLILFSDSLHGQTIQLGSEQLLVSDYLVIDGPGADLLAVSGNGQSRVFEVANSRRSISVSISGLTIQDGYANEDSDDGGNGGGILNEETLILDAVEVRENTSYGEAGFGESARTDGGGIYNTGTLIISASTIANNVAEASMGAFAYSGNANGAGIYNSGELYVTNCTIAGNRTLVPTGLNKYERQYGRGGGIYNAGEAFIANTTVVGGFAYTAGGGIFNSASGTLELVSTVVAGNEAHNEDDQVMPSDVSTDSTLLTILKCLIECPDGHSAADKIDGNVVGVPAALLDLDYYGGPTRTTPPASDSPAIDAGLNPLDLPTDQRGEGFPRVVGPAADIGAVERQE